MSLIDELRQEKRIQQLEWWVEGLTLALFALVAAVVLGVCFYLDLLR